MLDSCRGDLPKYTIDAFDCDKFCAVVRGRLIELCEKEGFPETQFCAQINHWPADGRGYHAALIAIDSDGMLLIYEPQTGALSDVESTIKKAQIAKEFKDLEGQIKTIKGDLLANTRVHLFAAPEFLGHHLTFNDDRFQIWTKWDRIQWKAWKAHGAGIGNVRSVAQMNMNVVV